MLWLGFVLAVPFVRPFGFTTLLPLPAYPVSIALGILIAMNAVRHGDPTLVMPGWPEAMRLAFRQTLAVACALFTLAVGMKDPGISRLFLAVYLATAGPGFVLLNRFQPGWLLRGLYRGGARLPTLILGDTSLFPDLDRWLAVRKGFGLQPAGVVSYNGVSPQIQGLPVVGDFADLKAAIGATGARQVIMLSLPRSPEDAEHLARTCAACGCRLLIHNDVTFHLSYPLRVLMQDGYSFLTFQDEPLEDPLNRGLKRALDMAVALPVVLFLLPPLTVLVWVMQSRQSPGPVFFSQLRSGRGGAIFRIRKYRTLHQGAGDEGRQVSSGDARVFRFGRLLRRTSLDELPQFINVLTGEMSVVGPRPHFVQHDDLFAGTVNDYRVRFFVKPGITGLAQSRGFRGVMQSAESIQQRLQLDLIYIHSWSIWLDLTIIARTAWQMIRPPPEAQ